MITVPDYFRIFEAEYGKRLIPVGVSIVRFVVPQDEATVEEVNSAIKDIGSTCSLLVASVDSAVTKAHLSDKVFHEFARQVDWIACARVHVLLIYEKLRLRCSPEACTLSAVAALNAYDYAELRRDFNKELQQVVGRDFSLSQPFRIGMMRLCQAVVEPSPETLAISDAIIGWLTGTLQVLGPLKPASIYRKITRSNGRAMLASAARWIRSSGYSGTILLLDIQRVTERARLDGINYSRTAAMEAFEMLRQAIDSSDETEGLCIIVLCNQSFDSEEAKGINLYRALKMRIADDVRDMQRDNPFAPLARLCGGD